MTLRDDIAFIREAYLHDIAWANPAQAERDFDDIIRKIRAEAWDKGALWGAVECDAIPNETVQWLAPGDNPYREERS